MTNNLNPRTSWFKRTWSNAKMRFGSAKVHVVATLAALGLIGGAIGAITGVKQIVEWIHPPIPPFTINESALEVYVTPKSGLLAEFPVDWEIELAPKNEAEVSATSKWMTLSIGTFENKSISEVMSMEGGENWKKKDIETLHLTAKGERRSLSQGQIAEYESSETNDTTTINFLVPSMDDVAFVRCDIEGRAVTAYRQGCLDILNRVKVAPDLIEAPTFRFFEEIRTARFWADEPAMFDKSYEYLVNNWDEWRPDRPHASEEPINVEVYTMGEVFRDFSTLQGVPIGFVGVVHGLEKLSVDEEGNTRWNIQVTGNTLKPDQRFYVTTSSSSNVNYTEGDMVVVHEAMLIAGGSIIMTDEGLDDGLHVLARDVYPVPFSDPSPVKTP